MRAESETRQLPSRKRRVLLLGREKTEYHRKMNSNLDAGQALPNDNCDLSSEWFCSSLIIVIYLPSKTLMEEIQACFSKKMFNF